MEEVEEDEMRDPKPNEMAGVDSNAGIRDEQEKCRRRRKMVGVCSVEMLR